MDATSAKMLLVSVLLLSALTSAATGSVDVVSVGTMRLCRPTAIDATISSDRYTGKPVALIQLNDNGKATLARLTTQAKGKRLSVTLNGETVAEPLVLEPILGGVFEISGLDKVVLEQIVKAVTSDC